MKFAMWSNSRQIFMQIPVFMFIHINVGFCLSVHGNSKSLTDCKKSSMFVLLSSPLKFYQFTNFKWDFIADYQIHYRLRHTQKKKKSERFRYFCRTMHVIHLMRPLVYNLISMFPFSFTSMIRAQM